MASKIIHILGAAVLGIGFATSVYADCDIESGIGFHSAGLDGDKQSVDKAIECLEGLEQQSPEDARVLAYLGSSYSLKARDSDEVADKMRFTNFGLDSLDYAVELAPNDFEIRVIRWKVNAALPSLFSRDKHLVQDLHKLDAIFQKVQSPRMAGLMISAYAALAEIEPDKAAMWKELGAKAQNLAQ